jgi:peptidyl-prolyl cis-trans isomerase SurA
VTVQKTNFAEQGVDGYLGDIMTAKRGSSARARSFGAQALGMVMSVALVAATGPVLARSKRPAAMPAPQDEAAPAPAAAGTNAFGLPDKVVLLGKNDPNLRKATAVVNGDVITGTDVDQRLALVVAANGSKVSPEELQQLRQQILRNLIDESLQIQEAKTADSTLDDNEIEGTYSRVASENFHQTVPALDAYLAKIGSAPGSLKRQIRAELSWQRVLRKNVQPFVNVSTEEVKELIERMKAAKGTEEYHLGEIYLSATPDSRAVVADNAQRIIEQIRQGGSFVAYARQYSEATTKAVGGDLGWIRLSVLPAELAAAARDMQPGQLVGPIELRGGFSVLLMIDKRKVLTADPRDALLALKQVSLAFPANLAEAELSKRAAAFETSIKSAKGCGGVNAVAASIGAQVVANDQVKARDLPGPLQELILKLGIGESTPPFVSPGEGVRMLMLCGRDDPKAAAGPNFDEVMAQIEDDRVNKRAQMYLRDLRRDAIIEYN